MQRLAIACVAAGLALVAATLEAAAQERTYEEHALRIDEGPGTLRIVRGIGDSVVLRIGSVRSVDVARVMGPSPNAVVQAKLFEANYRPGVWIASLGIAVMGGAIGASRMHAGQFTTAGLTITSFALIAYGASRLETAYRALSKAIWWYNRDLTT